MKKLNYYLTLFLVLIILSVPSFSQEGKKPKNIIILIGDGMGTNTVSTLLLSDKDNAFRRFTSVGFSVTCSADNLITDSAAGATALSTGYRTNNHFIGVNPEGKPLRNIMEAAKDNGKSAGVVATSSVTHATPAGFVTHVSDRQKERSIAYQLVDSNIDIAIGGGLGFFAPQNDSDKTDLTVKLKEKGYKVYTDLASLKAHKGNERYYAMLEKVSLKPAGERDYSLGDLTRSALASLSSNKNGFVLMVEGSQIDWGAHSNNQKQLLGELKDFNTAVHAALDFAEKDGNTLVVVTADHETGGVTITAGKPDASEFTLNFGSKGHTAAAVGVFAKGPGEEYFRGIFNNYEIGRKLFFFVEPAKHW